MNCNVHGGALAPKQILLPFSGNVFPVYAAAEQYGQNCQTWQRFYLGFVDRFLDMPTEDHGNDLRVAHAGLLSALEVAGAPVPPGDKDLVWELIERCRHRS